MVKNNRHDRSWSIQEGTPSKLSGLSCIIHTHDIAWPEISGSKRPPQADWVLRATQTAGQSVHRGQDFHFMTSRTAGAQGLISTRWLDASGQASSVNE
jgi:hypothetical protein